MMNKHTVDTLKNTSPKIIAPTNITNIGPTNKEYSLRGGSRTAAHPRWSASW